MSKTTYHLALYIVALIVVVIALLVVISALPPRLPAPDTDSDVPATSSVPVIIEPAHKPPTPVPTFDPNALYIQ